MRKSLWAVGLLLATAAVATAREPVVPVQFGAIPELDACGSQGEVRGLNPKGDNFLAVREGPGADYAKVDEIHEGQWIILCEEAEKGAWFGIVYDPTGELDCGTGSPIAEKRVYDGPCKSGWVSSKFITMLAG
jgi:hypothetical protein